MAFDDNRSDDEVDILVWLNEGEVVVVVRNEGAYAHVVPYCIACGPCYDKVTCDRTFKGEAGQADGEVGYLRHQRGNKEGNGRSGPALAGLKRGNKLTTAADAERHNRLERDLLIISLEKLGGADLWSREVGEDSTEEGVNGLNPAHCVCGKPIVGDVYQRVVSPQLFP